MAIADSLADMANFLVDHHLAVECVLYDDSTVTDDWWMTVCYSYGTTISIVFPLDEYIHIFLTVM